MYSKTGYMQYLSLPSEPVPKPQTCGNGYGLGMVSKIRHRDRSVGEDRVNGKDPSRAGVKGKMTND